MIPEHLKEHLRDITQPDRSGHYLSGGIAMLAADGRSDRFMTGALSPGDAPGDLPHLHDHRIRVASISKAVTALVCAELVQEGRIALANPVGPLLSLAGYPSWLCERHMTLDQLLSHQSGLADWVGYFTDPPEDLPSFLNRSGSGVLADWPVGEYFFYANLNYVLAGAVIEVLTQQRFDHIAREYVLKPMGIAGGFNWSGVQISERSRHLPLYQNQSGRLVLESDGPETDWGADLVWRSGLGLSLKTYRLARDTHLFSPHAGLRLSLAEMARLARALGSGTEAARLCRTTQWVFDGSNGAWSDGLFPEVGLGLTIYRSHGKIPSKLCGHAGHALGFTGGVWCNLTTGTGWAYFLNGARDETAGHDEETFFSDDELAILRAF